MGNICGCRWKIENFNYFFPSFIFNKLQDRLEDIQISTTEPNKIRIFKK